MNITFGVQVSYFSALGSVVGDGVRIGENKTRIDKSKVRSNKSFQVMTTIVYSVFLVFKPTTSMLCVA